MPFYAKSGHVLDKLIGIDDFNALAFTFGGTQLEIPRCANLERTARDIKILQAKRAGFSVHYLARVHRLTVRTIRDAIKRAERETGEDISQEIQEVLEFIL